MAVGYSAVDNAHFEGRGKGTRQDLVHFPHLLCVARFATEKNHERMIEAFLASEPSSEFYLKMVGGGPLWDELTMRYGGVERLVFVPWQHYDLLPELYRQADGLVLPSVFEPWGLVVNEAMAAGLPVLLSEQCGCVPELAGPENSLVFDGLDGDSIRKAFDEYGVLSVGQRRAMGKASAVRVAAFDTANWAKRFMELAGDDTQY
jgi:glycosyltransferase involved in cell wall biosynthesis